MSEVRVLALELDRVAGGDFRCLFRPSMARIRHSVRKNQGTTRHVGDEESFFKTLARECSEGVPVINISMTRRPAPAGTSPGVAARNRPLVRS